MSALRLLEHFDRVAEAPGAVPRLRRFILDLAVRGKLVAQDPSDEPAVELLRHFERRRLEIGKGRPARKAMTPSEAATSDKPFEIPDSWSWCRLADTGLIVAGGTPPSGDADNFADTGEGIPWLTPADLGRSRALYVTRGQRDLTPQGFQRSSATLLPKGSVLFTSRAPIGYTAIAAQEVSTNQGFKSVVPFVQDSSRYIAVYFQAFGPWIDSKAPGTTFREVSGKIVSGLPFPLPPLNEQHRIVTKVDELMALCDRLEAAQAERETRSSRLLDALLHEALAGSTVPHSLEAR